MSGSRIIQDGRTWTYHTSEVRTGRRVGKVGGWTRYGRTCFTLPRIEVCADQPHSTQRSLATWTMATLRQILALSKLEAERAEKERERQQEEVEQGKRQHQSTRPAAKEKKDGASLSRVEDKANEVGASPRNLRRERKDSHSKNSSKKKEATDVSDRDTRHKQRKTAEAAVAMASAKRKEPTENSALTQRNRDVESKKRKHDDEPKESEGPKKLRRVQSDPSDKRGRGRPPKLNGSESSVHDEDEAASEIDEPPSSKKASLSSLSKGSSKHDSKSAKKHKRSREAGPSPPSDEDAAGEPASKKKPKQKDLATDMPTRTTGRSKKQVNYRNNGAGDTGGVNQQLIEEEKKFAKEKEMQRQNTQRTPEPVPEAPRAIVRWIECTKCNKWRKVGVGIDLDALPDNWQCDMNGWDPSRASCTIPEEVDDKSKQNDGGSGLFSGPGAYKKIGCHELSYRQLIYTYYRQTTQTIRRQFAQRATAEFADSSAHVNSDELLTEIDPTKRDKKKSTKKEKKSSKTLVDFALPMKLTRKKVFGHS